jgi:hypothetical protein
MPTTLATHVTTTRPHAFRTVAAVGEAAERGAHPAGIRRTGCGEVFT